ncbi:MAG: hypothetical protein V1494_00020 [Candidatus Diapherotrites archaeon]
MALRTVEPPIIIKRKHQFTGVHAKALATKSGRGPHKTKSRRGRSTGFQGSGNIHYSSESMLRNLSRAEDPAKPKMGELTRWDPLLTFHKRGLGGFISPETGIIYLRNGSLKRIETIHVDRNNCFQAVELLIGKKGGSEWCRQLLEKIGINSENWREKSRGLQQQKIGLLKMVFEGRQ